jgi:hypothetical protein
MLYLLHDGVGARARATRRACLLSGRDLEALCTRHTNANQHRVQDVCKQHVTRYCRLFGIRPHNTQQFDVPAAGSMPTCCGWMYCRQPSGAMPAQVYEPCSTLNTAVVTLPVVQVSHSLRFAALPSLHVQNTSAWHLGKHTACRQQ